MLPELNGFTIFSATCELENMRTTKANQAGTQRGDPGTDELLRRLGAKSAVRKKDFSSRQETSNTITAEQGITQPGKTGARLIIAESRAMREIVNFVQWAAASEASSFLIESENETGKDLAATIRTDAAW
jgi:transcriptional regulator with GAF, ATPase, and Fis domain